MYITRWKKCFPHWKAFEVVYPKHRLVWENFQFQLWYWLAISHTRNHCLIHNHFDSFPLIYEHIYHTSVLNFNFRNFNPTMAKRICKFKAARVQLDQLLDIASATISYLLNQIHLVIQVWYTGFIGILWNPFPCILRKCTYKKDESIQSNGQGFLK